MESFGSPRKFARTARRVGHQMPVLTVLGGRSAAGQQAAASHTAAAATPLVTQEALFAQAGIIAVPGMGELIEVAAMLASQPLPAGDRIAIVSNAGGAGVLAADACGDNGLRVAALSAATQRRLRALLPPGAAVAGPVDTTAAVSLDAFRACLEEIAADDGVDAVVAVTVPTAIADLTHALTKARVSKPLTAAVLDQQPAVRLIPASDPVDPTAASRRKRAPPPPGHRPARRPPGHPRLCLPRRSGAGAEARGRLPCLAGTAAGPDPRPHRSSHRGCPGAITAFLAGEPAGGCPRPPSASCSRATRSRWFPPGELSVNRKPCTPRRK